ncbi:MAG: hypothetical protein JNL83_37825 [Myxococcales bacterium]|nr:hypothetical protein [Myxococcales bacterium]
MQDTPTPSSDSFHADPSVTTWWAPSLPAGAHPTLVDIPRAPIAPPPPAGAGLAITLVVLGLVFAPCMWACWAYAGGQLRLIDSGARARDGRGAIAVAYGIAITLTLLQVVLILFLLLGAGRP